MDPLATAIAERQAAARRRAESLRAKVPAIAGLLYARGATRVVLFGSLATGADPHADTDVDLWVEGLDDSALGEALFDIQASGLGAKVDLVNARYAGERVKRAAARDGIEIPHEPG